MRVVLFIDFKMPTIVGILKFITRTNDTICCSEQENCSIYLSSNNKGKYDLHAHVSWACKKFYNLWACSLCNIKALAYNIAAKNLAFPTFHIKK